MSSAILTERESEVLGYLLQGLTRPEVALAMHIAEETVKSHQSNIIKKYGARNMLQVVAIHLRSPTQEQLKLQRIIFQAKMRNLSKRLAMKYESELNKELDELLNEVMKG